MLTVSEFAERAGKHRTRVHAWIKAGRIKAELQHGVVPFYMIAESELEKVKDLPNGRPRKNTQD